MTELTAPSGDGSAKGLVLVVEDERGDRRPRSGST